VAQVIEEASQDRRFIAHCLTEEGQRLSLAAAVCGAFTAASHLILIGPEGDFTKNEIDRSLERSFLPVTLGETRLRTETAGVVAATLMCID
jgi:16S rRNA (uracil1498-N3)-methyltransferase